MGQQNTSQSLCQNLIKPANNTAEDLLFYLTVEDAQFGHISVYTSTKRPSSYIAKIQKSIENSKIYNIFEQIENSQLSCLASLHAFEITRQKYCTGQIEQKITAYWEYYNYSFEDFLKMRFLKRIPFTENEIWLIVKGFCQAFSLFSFHQLVLDFDLKHIMVVPEGKLKMYWHHVELKSMHLKYYQRIKDLIKQRKQLHVSNENRKFRLPDEKQADYFFFSPEQIEGIEKKQFFLLSRQETMKIDFTRANSFRLGMIILYCITLTNPIKTCYGNSNSTGEKRIKLMVLNSLYESKIENSQKYSDDLKHLIKLLLLQDPNKRIPIDCIQNVYERYMSIDDELAMGMGINENPLYQPSSSRKNMKEESPKNKFIKAKGFVDNRFLKNPSTHQKQQPSNFNSEKVIDESRIKSSQREYQNRNQNIESGYQIQPDAFDKFDTKTIKISSSYHKK